MSTKKYSHRTLVECSVGTTHTIDVLVRLRRADLDWWNSALPDHQAQLFKLIGRRVLPKECGEEIEGHANGRKRPHSGVVIGEKNLNSAAAGASAGGSRVNSKGKGKNAGRPSKKSKKGGGKGKSEKRSDKVTALSSLGKKEKARKHSADVTYLFGETIQITYRVEEVNTADSATLIYQYQSSSHQDANDDASNSEAAKKSNANGKKTAKSEVTTLAKFSHLKKLPKRIVVWCYPFDATNPTAPNPEGGGFPRPELIPITSLFSRGADE